MISVNTCSTSPMCPPEGSHPQPQTCEDLAQPKVPEEENFHLIFFMQLFRNTCTHTWKLAPLAMWLDTSLSNKIIQSSAQLG